MRRQNRSCDQCRKAKRACDAPSLWDIQRNSERTRTGTDASSGVSLAEEHLDEIDSRALRCSYCLRTRKQCTFHWVRAQLQTGPAGDVSTQAGTNVRRVPDPARAKAKRQRPRPQPGPSPPQSALPAQGLDVNASALLDMLQAPPSTHDLTSWGPMETGFANFTGFPTSAFDTMPMNGVFDASAFDTNLHPSMLNPLDATSTTSHPHPIDCSPASDLHHTLPHVRHQSTTEDENGENGWPLTQTRSAPDAPFQPSPSNSYESDISTRSLSLRHYSDSVARSYGTSISPFSAGHLMTTNTNKGLISDNLMRIYHDVLEHALSCWLSEETCPYRPDSVAKPSSNGVSWLASNFEKLNVLGHYEPKQQENRIYRRVVKLDKVAQSTKLIKLTRSEDKAASKALHLAIMAFATQWAQGSSRERERFPQSLASFDGGDLADDMNADFDRTLQKSFWAQAKRALQDCSDMECFRVVCADLIMGLAQKPMDDEDLPFDRDSIQNNGFGPPSPIVGGEGSIASQISDIIAAEGPPVFMERAARKMHALKFQYEARETGVLDSSKSSLGLERATSAESLSEEERGTIGLVYWMTVMFDTVSSSMNGRPVVVSDEECHHDPTYPSHPEHDAFNIEYSSHNARWWAELFIRENKEGVLRWPCSVETATKGVVAAAPVKVILFRHVSYLQNTVRSKYRGEAVEKVIENSMAVYKHWNVTYGAFFRDLVQQYDTVPTHVQSWFVCVVAHFHCAALLLADLIELVDENDLGLEYSTQVRLSVDVVRYLRQDSAAILSDLARVSTSPRAGDIPGTHISDLHFAVVEGSILTEPWTMILIRAFTKAAILHLTEVEESVRHDPSSLENPTIMMLAKRCEDCTKALYCLGKKSDMARNIATILSSALIPYLMPSASHVF